jgi:hypothetical protein
MDLVGAFFQPFEMTRTSMTWEERFESDEPKQELFGESERKFFSKLNDDELTFQVDSQGRATGMVLHVDGKDIPIKRID